MANKEKVKSIIKDLMQQLYEAKGFDNLYSNPLERNIFEAEMKELWEDVEAHSVLYTDEREEYEEEIESLKADIDDLKDYNDDLREKIQMLESDNTDLIDRNYDLNEENDKLKERLSMISKVVNDIWC
jgi:predicted RNase H-like nuclease (RuvC/YqgF family)